MTDPLSLAIGVALEKVAEAVFNFILSKADKATDKVAEKAAEKLFNKAEVKRAEKLAYQKALTRAYTAFARQYPDVAASLFDSSFLAKEGAPELAKQLIRNGHPDPGVLAQAWAASFGVRPPEATMTEVTAGCAYFLDRLEDELKAELVFQALFDSKALDAIESHLERLTDELKKATDIANSYADVIAAQSKSPNVYNAYYSGNFNQLADLYILPNDVFQRVHVTEFVGRDWLTAKVDEFLATHRSGVFILEGEAGVGKTSFMAHLVHTRRYLHLFAEQVPGEGNVQRALQSLGSQLVTRYRIEEYVRRDALPEIASFPDFLSKLLRLAAPKLAAGEKLVIVCDALDEAGVAANGNAFGLPKVLPDGVFLILSQRPIPDKCHFDETPPHREVLDASSDENKADLKAYLTAVAHRPEIAGQINAQGYSETQFIETLAEKSGGVWMYLYYIISEISSGNRAPLDLKTLPNGLAGYYEQFWRKWRDNPDGKWDKVYAPLLATLAAARDFSPLDWLMDWSGVAENKFAVKRLLDEHWKAFIKQDSQKRYALYHASLRDFLTADTNRLSGLSGLAEEMGERTCDAHRRIVEQLRTRCSGEWVKLIDDDYARRNLCAHLDGAGLQTEMFALVTESDAWAKARYEKEESHVEYLTDLALAWAWVDSEQGWNAGRQIRCALVESTMHTLAVNISLDLLVQLVQTGLWSPTRALSNIPQMSESWQQAEAIKNLTPYLPEILKAEALHIVGTIQDESNRTHTLVSLTPYLPDTLKAEALGVAHAIQNEYYRAHALISLVPYLPDTLKTAVLAEVLEAVHTNKGEYNSAVALSKLVPHLPEPLKSDVLAEALQAIRISESQYDHADVLIDLAPYLPNALKADLLAEALQAARAIQDTSRQAEALARLAPNLPDPLKADVFAEALATAHASQDGYSRASALMSLAPYLPESLKANTFTEALRAARAIQNEFIRASVLSRLAPHLPDTPRTEALEAARAIQDKYYRALTLGDFIPFLPESLKVDAFTEALESARAIQDKVIRAKVLSSLAAHLPDTLKTEALEAARAIQDKAIRADALRKLASHLPDTLKTDVLAEALEVTYARKDDNSLADVLISLVPYLPESLKADAFTEALEAARAIQDKFSHAEALGRLAPCLPDTLKTDVLTEALEMVHATKDAHIRANVLGIVAPHLPDTLWVEALEAARTIQDKYYRAYTLGVLASHLPNALKADVFAEALGVARSIQDESIRADALNAVAQPTSPKIERVFLTETFPLEWKISLPGRVSIGDQISWLWAGGEGGGLKKHVMWSNSLHALAGRTRHYLLADFASLVPLIKRIGGQEAIAEMYKAVHDVTQWWP